MNPRASAFRDHELQERLLLRGVPRDQWFQRDEPKDRLPQRVELQERLLQGGEPRGRAFRDHAHQDR